MVSVSVGVYQLDGFLGFHIDLLALCDGEISVLRRDKAANLFSVLQICHQGSGKAGEGSSSARLLGGETRSHLMDTTKEDELLARSMQKVLALGLAGRQGI